jgi:hypothetical protein
MSYKMRTATQLGGISPRVMASLLAAEGVTRPSWTVRELKAEWERVMGQYLTGSFGPGTYRAHNFK